MFYKTKSMQWQKKRMRDINNGIANLLLFVYCIVMICNLEKKVYFIFKKNHIS